MSDPPVGTNRLGAEASPYLQQHADNPVHWQPWDTHALQQARDRDVPIFLSVGYSACHWCHVMESESFQNDDVAAVLNEHYVPIKVDREERPDIDRIYQTICQLVTHSGGWPLSVWLTPDEKPFYVGTYFPITDRRGHPGFLDLLAGLAETWETDRAGIKDRATQWMEAIKGEVETIDTQPTTPDSAVLLTAADSAVRSADPNNGGFGTSGPKFPQPTRIELLFHAHYQSSNDSYRSVACNALNAMQSGGLFDHVGGGFHRYTVDPEWTTPHFEKMLYDNAELTRVFLHGYQLTGDDQYADTVEHTLEFVDRELTHPAGGFYSTLDAQSDGVEGAYYTWTPTELRAAIADQTTANVFIDRYGVTDSGDTDGRSILTIDTSLDELAASYDLSTDEVRTRLNLARKDAFNTRTQRARPARDEKILAGWTGLMISAYAEASLILETPTYKETAVTALEFVESTHWDGDRLNRRYRDGDTGITGYLDDYAYLSRAALDVYQVTGTVHWLKFALDLASVLTTEFWDSPTESFFFTPNHGEKLVARPQELTDQSTPASAAIAIDSLLALSHFTPGDEFESIAETALHTYSPRINANPLQHASLALASNRFTTGSQELTIVTGNHPNEWLSDLASTFLPNRLISIRPPEIDDWLTTLNLDTAPPIWADRTTTNGPAIYACQSFSCSPPIQNMTEALDWFNPERPTSQSSSE